MDTNNIQIEHEMAATELRKLIAQLVARKHWRNHSVSEQIEPLYSQNSKVPYLKEK